MTSNRFSISRERSNGISKPPRLILMVYRLMIDLSTILKGRLLDCAFRSVLEC